MRKPGEKFVGVPVVRRHDRLLIETGKVQFLDGT
jgi:hypothetical protein